MYYLLHKQMESFMSFYQFPVASFLGTDICVQRPSSTVIKEDFLVLFADLEKIKYRIKEKDIDTIPSQIVNIIKVYNSDVKFINRENKNFEVSEFQSFEKFCKYRGNESTESLRKEYDDKKNRAGIRTAKERNELCQLKQLGGLCSTLANKITRTIERLKRCDSIAEQIPSCPLEKIAFDDQFLAPRLRTIEEPVEKSQAVVSAPAALTEDQPPETFSVIETVVSAPAPLPSIHSDVTVIYDVGYGNSLGICCDPSWAENPIVFTNHENGWAGQVPVDKDWKFVVLQNDRILKWENGTNRRCDAHTNALTINANEVKFS